jgi:heat shock protein HslJ
MQQPSIVHLLVLPAVLVLWSLLPACSTGPDKAADPGPAIFGSWTLVEVEGSPVRPDIEGGRPTLSIAPDGGIAGFAGVNRFAGQTDLAGLREGRFDAGALVSTKMAGPPAAMELEGRYMGVLDRAGRISLQDDSLTLLRGDTVLARFVR